MRRLIQTIHHSQIGIYLECFALLALVAGVVMVAMGLQCQTRGCSTTSTNRVGLDLPLAYRADMKANGHLVDVWIEFGETGVFTPATTAQGTVITTDDGQTIPFLDDLAEKGYIAIRVPHAPPNYTLSRLLPGINAYPAVQFTYYAPPTAATPITATVPITRRADLEGIVNSKYPITDGRSHWEVWWLPPGDKFPIPNQPFRLQAEDNPLALAFRIDFVDAPGTACAGCPVGVLAYNGYVFVGPFPAALRYGDATMREPLVSFGAHCGYMLDALAPTTGQYITPTMPFTHVHCLENWDTVTRTFTIHTASAQGWTYTYYYQQTTAGSAPVPVGSLPFIVEVGPPPNTWEPGTLGILAVTTPPIVVTDTVRETFTITATSTVSPSVRASAVSFALAPGYKLDEGGAPPYTLYLPLVLRSYP